MPVVHPNNVENQANTDSERMEIQHNGLQITLNKRLTDQLKAKTNKSLNELFQGKPKVQEGKTIITSPKYCSAYGQDPVQYKFSS